MRIRIRIRIRNPATELCNTLWATLHPNWAIYSTRYLCALFLIPDCLILEWSFPSPVPAWLYRTEMPACRNTGAGKIGLDADAQLRKRGTSCTSILLILWKGLHPARPYCWWWKGGNPARFPQKICVSVSLKGAQVWKFSLHGCFYHKASMGGRL